MTMRAPKSMKMNPIFKVKLNKNWIESKKYSKVSRDSLIELIEMMMMEVLLKERLFHSMVKNEYSN